MAIALQDIHRQHVIHFDVKPANIIIREDGPAVLIDYGLARHDELPDLLAEETDLPIGTSAYMAPEQVLGQQVMMASLSVDRGAHFENRDQWDGYAPARERLFAAAAAREVRDLVVFAAHSLLKDPPFSRLDMISCRNLLIYLDRELQQQVCRIFRFRIEDRVSA